MTLVSYNCFGISNANISLHQLAHFSNETPIVDWSPAFFASKQRHTVHWLMIERSMNRALLTKPNLIIIYRFYSKTEPATPIHGKNKLRRIVCVRRACRRHFVHFVFEFLSSFAIHTPHAANDVLSECDGWLFRYFDRINLFRPVFRCSCVLCALSGGQCVRIFAGPKTN